MVKRSRARRVPSCSIRCGCHSHINDYEERSSSNKLLTHLDKDVAWRIIGSENDYPAGMKKLENYFGDKRKVIQDCINEISNFPKVVPGDFKNLVALKMCISVNFARLSSMKLEAEMSNTQSMKVLEGKFPQ